ncbi:geranylgeranylglyceryl/heptaprenylglyceryl phosphate synthase [Wenyingzhuangia sp. IMCC45533]
MNILKTLQKAQKNNQKLIAVLMDPDKISESQVEHICTRINDAPIDFILMGGSIVNKNQTEIISKATKKYSQVPVILFPGDYQQLTNQADALLFLNLISGDNPEYLVKQQIKSVPFLSSSSLEIISTGYVLIDGDTQTATMQVSNTKPIAQNNIDLITQTAKAGELMGQQLVYLEAGSGAITSVGTPVIKSVYNSVNIPIIVGGGIKTLDAIQKAHSNGATLVVIGTAFEKNILFK